MNVVWNNYTIGILSWGSKDEMMFCLAKLEKGYILLGEDRQYAKKFSGILSDLEGRNTFRFGIGICLEQHGLEPGLLLQPSRNELIVGFDNEVTCINLEEKKIVYKHQLFCLFHRFISLPKDHIVIIVDEIGVFVMKEDGEKLWSYTCDLITDSTVEDGILCIHCMDSPSMQFSIYDGTVANQIT